MSRISQANTFYEIQEKIGEGATSEVYSAFRRDTQGWLNQPVALKIIKSKKNVQILKLEYEKLLQVRSKHCIQVFGLENLKQGSALVLERIYGVTLAQLLEADGLSLKHKCIVLRQIKKGLSDLHGYGLIHGDLNLNNILINQEGTVKLIDFGFFNDHESWVSPHFASPKILAGEKPNQDSDWFALSRISKLIFNQGKDRVSIFSKVITPVLILLSFIFISEKSEQRVQESLAQIIFNLSQKTSLTTKALYFERSSTHEKRSPLKNLILLYTLALVIFISIFIPDNVFESHHFATLKITGEEWVEFSVNQLPVQYGPIEKSNIRAGQYLIHWKTPHLSKHENLKLKPQQTFWLKAENKTL